jgi:hypothetical protein
MWVDARNGLLRAGAILAGFVTLMLVRGERVTRGWPLALGAAVLIGAAGAWNDSRRRRAAEGGTPKV